MNQSHTRGQCLFNISLLQTTDCISSLFCFLFFFFFLSSCSQLSLIRNLSKSSQLVWTDITQKKKKQKMKGRKKKPPMGEGAPCSSWSPCLEQAAHSPLLVGSRGSWVGCSLYRQICRLRDTGDRQRTQLQT